MTSQNDDLLDSPSADPLKQRIAELERLCETLLEGRAELAMAYLAHRVLELERLDEKKTTAIAELRLADVRTNERIDKAGREVAALKKVNRNETKQPTTTG